MTAPTSSAEFDRAYRAPLTAWGDVRIPEEVKALAGAGSPRRSLELGCGVGRISRYLAGRGLEAVAIDFSPVAIDKARERASRDAAQPTYLVGDVTRLDAVQGPFDIALDVGCFHCLTPDQQRGYVSEIDRLLAPGGTHLIWALDATPSDLRLSPAAMKDIFGPRLELREARASRRRIAASHWYWLTRASHAADSSAESPYASGASSSSQLDHHSRRTKTSSLA